MGRLHSNGKGISASAIPYSRTPPAWLKVTPEQVVDQICKLAKKGATPSQIGVVLRDSHGVAQTKFVTGELDTYLRRTGVDSVEGVGRLLTWRHRKQDSAHFKVEWYARLILKELGTRSCSDFTRHCLCLVFD